MGASTPTLSYNSPPMIIFVHLYVALQGKNQPTATFERYISESERREREREREPENERERGIEGERVEEVEGGGGRWREVEGGGELKNTMRFLSGPLRTILWG